MYPEVSDFVNFSALEFPVLAREQGWTFKRWLVTEVRPHPALSFQGTYQKKDTTSSSCRPRGPLFPRQISFHLNQLPQQLDKGNRLITGQPAATAERDLKTNGPRNTSRQQSIRIISSPLGNWVPYVPALNQSRRCIWHLHDEHLGNLTAFQVPVQDKRRPDPAVL